MIKNSEKQSGSAHVVIVVVIVIALLGVLGYVAWSNFLAPKSQPVNVSETTKSTSSDDSQVDVEYKTVKINGYNFRYPMNENNEKIIVISDDSTPALNTSYAPIRSYFSDKDVSDDCKNYVAGLINANSEKEIIDYSYLSRFYAKDRLDDALADGTVVRVGDKDLYLGGPIKQNEPCADISESSNMQLQDLLSDMKDVRLSWLKSLELVE